LKKEKTRFYIIVFNGYFLNVKNDLVSWKAK